MKKYTVILTLIITLLFLSINCQYFTLMSNKGWMDKSGNDDVDIYISGNDFDGVNVRYPCYWKNGVQKMLEGKGLNASASDIAIYDGDIYIAGFYDNHYPCYWKNERLVKLSGPDGITTTNWVQRIKIIEDDIYICGYYNIGANYQACYWKNEKIHILPNPGTANAMVYDIEIMPLESGNKKVYCAGYYTIGFSNQYACAWEDDKIVFAETNVSYFITLTVKNDNVYLGGNYNSQPAVWTNYAERKILHSSDTAIYGIKFNGNDIYHGGSIITGNQTAVYWKNYVINYLDVTAGTISGAGKMYFYDDNIYFTGLNNSTACYWKNGTRIDLPRTGTQASAGGMIIVRRKK